MFFCLDQAKKEDLSRLTALEKVNFTHPDYADALMPRRQFRYLLSRPTAQILTLRGKDGVVGGFAVAFYRVNSRAARLYSLAVDPALQGRGLGQLLMSYAESAARRRKKTSIRLEMRADDLKLKSFYTKSGYEVIRCLPCYYNKSAAALAMEKRL